MSETLDICCTFKVTVVKREAGSIGSEYTVNGVRSPRLKLVVGKTYKFEIDAKGHPFYITTNAIGGTRRMDGALTEVHKDSDNGIEVGVVTFTPNNNHVGKPLYYQCNYHRLMGYKLLIVEK